MIPKTKSIQTATNGLESALESLRRANLRNELMMEASRTAWWEVDYPNAKLLCHVRWPQMLGYDPSEFPVEWDEIFRYIHPDDVAGIRKKFQDMLKGKELVCEGELRMRTRDGKFVWMRLRGQVASRDGGKPKQILGVISDMSGQHLDEEALRMKAETDALTGLLNRQALVRRAEEEVHRSWRYSRPLSMAIIDIDKFARLNEVYGRDYGDRVLQEMSDQSRSLLRTCDLFGRLGNNQFAVVLPETDIVGARDVADRLLKNIEELEVPSRHGKIKFTVSIGIAAMDTKEDPSLESLFRKADDALYQAKAAGPGQIKTNTNS